MFPTSGRIILCGGDGREVELYRCWKQQGLAVKAAGFEQVPALEGAGEADFREAAVLIAPLTGIGAGGGVRAPLATGELNLLDRLEGSPPGVLLLAGTVAEPLREELARRTALLLTGGDEELALLNAIPTAEGAIQRAMELSPVTLHGSRVLIFGLGRCGTALARALRGLGAQVTAVVRQPRSEARAYSMGLDCCDLSGAPEAAARAEFIFNTVPAPLLTASLLRRVRGEALILDLASSPGGTDFAAAAALGLNALLLPGLPGRAAPRTAARILDRVYRRLIAGAGKNIQKGS